MVGFSRPLVRPTLVAGASLCGANYLANWFLGSRLKEALQSNDQQTIGTDVWIGKCRFCLLRGHAWLTDVRFTNPPGYKFAKDDMIIVREVFVDLEMMRLLFKRKLDIEKLTFTDVRILVDNEDVWGPDFLFGKSNVKLLLDFQSEPSGEPAPAPTAPRASRANALTVGDSVRVAEGGRVGKLKRVECEVVFDDGCDPKTVWYERGEIAKAAAEAKEWITIHGIRELGFFNVVVERRGVKCDPFDLPRVPFLEVNKDGVKAETLTRFMLQTLCESVKADSAKIALVLGKGIVGACPADPTLARHTLTRPE